MSWEDLIVQSNLQPTVITWINHYSLLQHRISGTAWLQACDYVGIDGNFLRMLVGIPQARSSADLVLPGLISNFDGEVLLIGGDLRAARDHEASFKKTFPEVRIVASLEGYSTNLNTVSNLIKENPGVRMVIIGAGAPRQEELAVQVSRLIDRSMLIFTCGGWLDQLGQTNYYPRWAHPLGLTWLIRVIREPRRLWRRYSIHAVEALLRKSELERIVKQIEAKLI